MSLRHVEKASQFFSGTIAENINRGKSGDRVSAVVSPRPTSPRPWLTSSPRPIAIVSAAGTGTVTPSAVRAARNKNTATVASGSATHQSTFSALLHAARTVSVSVNVSTVSAVEMADLSPPSPSSPSSSSRLSVLADCSSVSPDVLDAAELQGAAPRRAALLQPAKGQIVVLEADDRRLVDQAVELGVFNAQLDQLTRQRMQVDVH